MTAIAKSPKLRSMLCISASVALDGLRKEDGMDKKLETYEDALQLWKDDPEAGRKLLYLNQADLPYNSQKVLLTRLRFQFHTLTAMQRGELADAV